MNTVIDEAIRYVHDIFDKDFSGHDTDHVMRVFTNAMLIAEKENCKELEIISLAALLHDTDDPKLFITENNANARSFLVMTGVDQEKITQIIDIINSVSWSKGKKPTTLAGQIVQDADRLDAIGAIGIARTFAYGGANNRKFHDSISHFHEKLLKIKNELNTFTARQIAETRHQFMLYFLQEYDNEVKLVDESISNSRCASKTLDVFQST